MTTLPKPKRLSFSEMWKLYITIQKNSESKEFLIDEIDDILSSLSPERYKLLLKTLYPKVDLNKIHPIDSISMLVDGLVHNKFFDYCLLIRGTKNG